MSRDHYTELREAIARQQAENIQLRAEIKRLTALVNDCPVCRQLNTRAALKDIKS